MIKEDCLFCKIVSGQIPSSKFWENEDFIAILNLFPNTKGVSLIIPKQHIASDIFNTDFDLVHKGLDAAKIAAGMLTKTLKPLRIALVTEGMMIDHMHIKLYPIYENGDLNGEGDPVFFDKFPGYITTQSGPEWSREDLDRLAGEIRSASNNNQ